MSQNNTAVAVTDQIKNTLQAMAPQFQSALPKHMPVEKFIRVAQTAILTNPTILKCEKNSLYTACIKAAQDGLLPDGKEAALVPFKDKAGNFVATYMPMVYGVLKKVRNSGDLASITPEIVFEQDHFEYWIDEDGPHLKHHIDFKVKDRGEPIAAYAVAKTKDGSVYIEVMDRGQINDVREVSKTKDSGPWSGPFGGEMWKKTVMRRLAKRLPMSTDLEQLFQRDDEMFDFKKEETPPSKETKGKATRLNSLMKDKAIKTEATKVDDGPTYESDEPGEEPV